MSQPARTSHRRVYQACVPCRERRVRCELGSVDEPHHGPCARCRRERRHCYFSATRKRQRSTASAAPPSAAAAARLPNASTSTPQRSNGSSDAAAFTDWTTNAIDLGYPARPVVPSASQRSGPPGDDTTAATLLRDPAYTSHDALNLLFEAGRHSERASTGVTRTSGVKSEAIPRTGVDRQPDAPSTTSDFLQPWSNLRFVQTGLFTAEEALDLVNYFHAYLAPFTPIISSSFQDPSMHQKLLEDEPILTVTILMLSSRYMNLSGPGAVSRSYMVHERLWQHLQGMISRMIFGQEQFTGVTNESGGSGEPGLGQTMESSFAGSSLGSLRTLGTCEALLLLSEWHPRSLHLPAGDDGDSIIVREAVRRTRASTSGVGGRIRIDWLEPVWRSDRMCWSMLGNALSLAVELGVFDEYDNTTIGARESHRDIWNDPMSSQRASLVQHLLWVYLTQTSGRLGCKNLTSVSVTDHHASVKHGETIRCWVGVASLMKRGNELLFPSRQRTRELIGNGSYLDVLRILNPDLRAWQREFERARLSRPMRSILSIEFAYVRVYIHSVALQAVVERCGRTLNEGNTIPVSTILNPFPGNEEYFMEVVTSARSILQTVVEELLPTNGLKHIPIRTYSRVLVGAMFCLKSFALGDKSSENIVSLDLVERTADALGTCVVDDVHLSNRFGELLQALSSSLRTRVARSAPSDASQCGDVTPSSNLAQQRSAAEMNESLLPSEAIIGARPYAAQNNSMVGNSGFDGQQPVSSSVSSGLEAPGYNPSLDMMGGIAPDDPLLNFAGMVPNQLGWSGGQDVFDMLEGFLDVQYEPYR